MQGRSRSRNRIGTLTCAAVLVAPVGVPSAWAQAPAPAAKAWTGTVGAGINLTQGNTDTLNYNLAFDLLHPFSTRNVMKTTGLYLRGTQNDTLNVNRTSLGFRDEITISGRTFVFGKLDYLRDTFKAIDYLVAPGAGLGFKVLDSDRTTYVVDAALGAVTEKNPLQDRRTSGAITLGEKLTHQLTSTASLKHEATALWKTRDLGDALYTLSVGISATLSSRAQLSFEVLNVYKNRPPGITRKNDVALITALTTKF
ncbi:MAG: DUF481 domain-containing protein [Vicinamibacterales bacterium]|nr:DUF481 domain-containing protein [Vicinamibacterales bacterium]